MPYYIIEKKNDGYELIVSMQDYYPVNESTSNNNSMSMMMTMMSLNNSLSSNNDVKIKVSDAEVITFTDALIYKGLKDINGYSEGKNCHLQ